MSGERKGERASARSTTSACIDGALSWDKRSLQSAQYGAGSSGLQNASSKAGIALMVLGAREGDVLMERGDEESDSQFWRRFIYLPVWQSDDRFKEWMGIGGEQWQARWVSC